MRDFGWWYEARGIMDKLLFTATAPTPDQDDFHRMQLYWDFDLQLGGPVCQAIQETLEQVRGVEDVRMWRYAATVAFRTRVISPSDFVIAVERALTTTDRIVVAYMFETTGSYCHSSDIQVSFHGTEQSFAAGA